MIPPSAVEQVMALRRRQPGAPDPYSLTQGVADETAWSDTRFSPTGARGDETAWGPSAAREDEQTWRPYTGSNRADAGVFTPTANREDYGLWTNPTKGQQIYGGPLDLRLK